MNLGSQRKMQVLHYSREPDGAGTKLVPGTKIGTRYQSQAFFSDSSKNSVRSAAEVKEYDIYSPNTPFKINFDSVSCYFLEPGTRNLVPGTNFGLVPAYMCKANEAGNLKVYPEFWTPSGSGFLMTLHIVNIINYPNKATKN